MLQLSFRAKQGASVAALAIFLLCAARAPSVAAQSPRDGGAPPSVQPSPTPTPEPERHVLADILRDQRDIWASPFHLARGDAKWLAPLGISAAALLASDQETGELGNSRRRISVSKDVSLAGNMYSTGGLAAAFYLVGRASGNARARETGLLGGEALIDSALVFTVLKNISQRPRPTHDDAQGEFFDGGHSFPSGHAASAWALATVVAHEYRRHRVVQFGAYGLAAAVSVSRYTGRNHFLSDVLVGSALGYGVGRYVYFKHHDPALDAPSGAGHQGEAESGSALTAHNETEREPAHSKLLPLVAPRFGRARREYGATLAWNF